MPCIELCSVSLRNSVKILRIISQTYGINQLNVFTLLWYLKQVFAFSRFGTHTCAEPRERDSRCIKSLYSFHAILRLRNLQIEPLLHPLNFILCQKLLYKRGKQPSAK